eukprot:COSAG02_NODE_1491_length_12358_cov_52.348014_16_plen_65_part_00
MVTLVVQMSAQEEAAANQAERAAAMQQHGHGHAESAGGRTAPPNTALCVCVGGWLDGSQSACRV